MTPAEMVTEFHQARARILAAFLAIDNAVDEPAGRDQMDQAHIAACAALGMEERQYSRPHIF